MNINPIAAEELLELSADAALDGVSVVAVEISTGEVVSACFNKLQVCINWQTIRLFASVKKTAFLELFFKNNFCFFVAINT